MNRAHPRGTAAVVVTALLVTLLGALLTAGCARDPSPSLQFSAPGKLARALEVAAVVADLGCDAVLVDKDGSAGDLQALERGDDGVSFSGFLDAAPGTYTLELTFSGVVVDGVAGADGARHFLGRLTSDTFTVVEGNSSEPDFSRGLDTLGRPVAGGGGDAREGDQDGDGLGFLDELITGADPGDDDSDDDGVIDGDDCAPASAANDFAIVAGDSLDDCDGDGFARIDPFFDVGSGGGPGGDCADVDAAVHPGVDDDCGSLLDEDCDPSSCPVNDAEGPSIELITPADGETWGCGMRVAAIITDPSDVNTAAARLTDDLLGGQPRTLVMSAGDDDTFTSAPLSLLGGSGYRPGTHALEVQATDGTGNTRTVTTSFELDLALPAIALTSAATAVIADGLIDGNDEAGGATLDFRATAPSPIASFTVFAAPPSEQNPTLFDLENATVLAELPAGGGTVDIDPAAFTERTAVWAVVVDDAARSLAPLVSGNASVQQNGDGTRGLLAASCDGDFTRLVPAVIVVPPSGADDLVTMTGKLQDAIDRARALDPTAQLSGVFALGVDGDGRVDLEDAGNFSFRWEYRFLKADGDGITVRWLTPAFGPDRPTVEVNADPSDDAPLAADPASLVDSDAAVAAYVAAGCGTFTGDDSDSLVLRRDVDSGTDRLLVFANGGGTLALDAVTGAEIFKSGCP